MAILVNHFQVSYRDAKGFIGRVAFHVAGDSSLNSPTDYAGAATTFINAVGGLTNGALQSVSANVGFGIITLSYGDNLEYPAEWMKAVMQFSNGSGQITRFKIPCPELDIFDTDGVTVLNDGTQAQVVAFVNAVKNADASGTFISNASGLAYTHFEGGLLRFGKQPRRFNERIKSSHLVAGEGE